MSNGTFPEESSSVQKAKRRSPNHGKIEALLNENAVLQEHLRDMKRMAHGIYAAIIVISILSVSLGYMISQFVL